MAMFRLQIRPVSRNAGRRATAAAAYRAGERLRDERSGELLNFSRRRDVLHAEIFLPEQMAGAAAAAWVRNRERLWNTAEHAEKRHNAKTAREYEVSLPAELPADRRVALARAFSQEIAERYKVAVDLAVHAPRAGGDPRNFHAHLLTTTREVTPTGLGAKAGIDMTPLERRRRDLPDHRQEYLSLRQRWAELTNLALREANLSVRVDHRSLAAQGIDREPQPRIPLMQLKMEQRGVRSELAERLRQEYRERTGERLARALPSNVAEGARNEPVPATSPPSNSPPASSARASVKPWDIEEIRRQAREAWLIYKSREAAKNADAARGPAMAAARGAAEEPEAPAAGLPRKDDLAL
jgi:ATP-dependent exoDNAse (exonuclease V) alpha subunit